MSSNLDIQAEQQLLAELQFGLETSTQPHTDKPDEVLANTARYRQKLRRPPGGHTRENEDRPLYYELGFMWMIECSMTVRADLEDEIRDSGKYEPGIAPHIAILRRKAAGLRWFEGEGFNINNVIGDEMEAIERALWVHTPKVNPAYITAAERNLADTDRLCKKYVPRMMRSARRMFENPRKHQPTDWDQES